MHAACITGRKMCPRAVYYVLACIIDGAGVSTHAVIAATCVARSAQVLRRRPKHSEEHVESSRGFYISSDKLHRDLSSQYFSSFQTTGNIWHFCSVGLKISALQPLTADPVLSWEQRVTSVAVTSTGHHTVALLGTQHGTLKKVST